MEAMYFDEDVRAAKRQQLESEALNFVYPAFEKMLEHLHSRALDKFKIDLEKSLRSGEGFARSVRSCAQSSMLDFDTGLKDTVVKYVDWDASKVRDKLQQNIDAHAASIQHTKLAELKAAHENRLSQALNDPVKSILEAGEQDPWASIRRIYRRQTESVVSAISTSLSEFELDQTALDKMISDLKEHARIVVEQKAREAAGKVLVHMKERFSTVFSHDNNSMPRLWTGKKDMRMITKKARLAALKVLAVMAALRLDDKPDKIERALICSLLDEGPLSRRSVELSSDPLASSTWEEVSPKDTLITPLQCKSIWRQFKAETEYIVTQAISMQEVQRDSTNWLPPAWAILLIALLGFNEFMFLLRIIIPSKRKTFRTPNLAAVLSKHHQGIAERKSEHFTRKERGKNFCSYVMYFHASASFDISNALWSPRYFSKLTRYGCDHRHQNCQHGPGLQAVRTTFSPTSATSGPKLQKPVTMASSSAPAS